LAQAEKARQDSLALVDARKRLDEEKAKRTDLENRFLSTGVLVMERGCTSRPCRTDISINSKPYLNMLAKMLIKYPKLQIEVAGHTDNIGSDAYTPESEPGRATAVMAYLISQAPELSGRLTAKGYGSPCPRRTTAPPTAASITAAPSCRCSTRMC